MALEQINDLVTIHVPTKEPGYNLNGGVWTKSSPDRQTLVDGILYCALRGSRLQTLDEAVEFRHDSGGADGSDLYQNTSTLIAMVHDGHAGNRAFMWEPSVEELGDLAKHPQIGNSYLQLSGDDVLMRHIKKVCEARSFIVPKANLELSVKSGVDNASVYSGNNIVQTLMPTSAGKNAAYIVSKCGSTGYVWFDRSEFSKGEMRVRPVGLGGDGCNDVNDVYADGDFGVVRRARGVQRSR